MQQRAFGRTGWKTSPIGFGAWSMGGDWGDVNEVDGKAALNEALDRGLNFIDTADAYGDGRSEATIASVLKERGGPRPIVATKAGQRLSPHNVSSYSTDNLIKFVDRSLQKLDVEQLDLLQLHCPPNEVYYMPEVFGCLDDLKKAGKLSQYGVSAEKVEEAIKAIEYPGVVSIQLIFNMFRHRPAELFFDLAKKKNVAIIVRVPLASGLLTGKLKPDTTFSKKDHRNYNRNGEVFNVGETFSGVPYQTGLQAVEELRDIVPAGLTMSQFALRWILMFDAVTVAIPGAKDPVQAIANLAAADAAPLMPETMRRVAEIYGRLIRPSVHDRW